MKKTGKIIPNGVSLEKHEYDTVLFLTTLGYDIELIPPSHIPNIRTPDFKMNGSKWEMKSPKGKSRSTLEHAFKVAVRQSPNVLFDLRRVQIPEEKAIDILSKLVKSSREIKKLLVVTKSDKLLQYGIDFN